MEKTFKTHLYREEEEIPVRVEYTANADELYVDRVIAESTGKEIITTTKEDVELTKEAHADFAKSTIYGFHP